MFKSLRLLALATSVVTLSACYYPDGTIDPAGTALAGAAVGAAVGAAAGVAIGAAAYRPVDYRPAYYSVYRPYYGRRF